MADNQIEFDIVAKLDSVDKSLSSLESKSQKTGKELQDNLGNRVENAVKGSFLGIVGAAAAAGAAILSGLAFRQVIQAAAEEQVAINNLNQSLANAGTFSAEASKGIQDFATNIQNTTTIADDAAIGLVALSRNFARTNEEAVKLTEAAIELSAATGISLEQAVEGLGKSLTGQAGRLAQQVPLLRGFTEEQLKAGAAIDAVLGRFGGSAAAQVNTFSGAFKQLQNVFGDLQESLGNLIVKSPALVAAFKFISEALRDVTSSISELGSEGKDPLGVFLQKGVDLANFFVTTFGPIIEYVAQSVEKLGSRLGALAATFVQLMSGEFQNAITTFREGVIPPTIEEDFTYSGTMAASGFLTGLSQTMANAPPLTEEFKNNVRANIVQPMDEAVRSVNLFDEAYRAITTNVAMSSSSIQQSFKQVKQAMFQNLVNGVQTAFSSIGSALVKGENVFAAFGKAILGMFGDIALQLGQFYLLLGIGNLFLNPGAAAGQIAAGIGLSILGGALKSLAGGSGGAPAPSTAATGSGVGGSGFSSGISDPATAAPVAEPAEPNSQVAVNIYGSVLGDKRELGRAVAEAINEANFSDGTTIARGAIA